MTRFTIVTGGMVALLACGLAFGGLWAPLGLIYITLFTFFMDRLTALETTDHPGQEFPAGNGLSVVLALVHFPLLYGAVAQIAGSDTFSSAAKIALFFGVGMFCGQISNSNAHELIHRGNRWLRRLGIAVYASLLFGHHASAHPRVHHIHVATDRDPNSARMGEGYYRFALRAWIGSFREGFRAETTLRRKTGAAIWHHPYISYLAGASLSLAVGYAIAGWSGVATLTGLAVYAQMQLLLSDYVQHYGLRRAIDENGKAEPVGPRHSWNAPQGFSSALMLNAPRHSDHHSHPGRAYPGLVLDRNDMPILPHSLPIMAGIALWPPLWRRVMDRRARTVRAT